MDWNKIVNIIETLDHLLISLQAIEFDKICLTNWINSIISQSFFFHLLFHIAIQLLFVCYDVMLGLVLRHRGVIHTFFFVYERIIFAIVGIDRKRKKKIKFSLFLVQTIVIHSCILIRLLQYLFQTTTIDLKHLLLMN